MIDVHDLSKDPASAADGGAALRSCRCLTTRFGRIIARTFAKKVQLIEVWKCFQLRRVVETFQT